MGEVVELSPDAPRRARHDGRSCTVIVLPVIRVERSTTPADPWDGLPSDSAPHHAALHPDNT